MKTTKNITVKNTCGAPPKAIKYKNERESILNELSEILNINEHNNTIIMYDIEENQDTMNKILDLKNKISDCFTCKNYAVFRNSETTKYPHRSIIKLVFKEMNYNVHVIRKNIKKSDKIIHTSLYLIEKK